MQILRLEEILEDSFGAISRVSSELVVFSSRGQSFSPRRRSTKEIRMPLGPVSPSIYAFMKSEV